MCIRDRHPFHKNIVPKYLLQVYRPASNAVCSQHASCLMFLIVSTDLFTRIRVHDVRVLWISSVSVMKNIISRNLFVLSAHVRRSSVFLLTVTQYIVANDNFRLIAVTDSRWSTISSVIMFTAESYCDPQPTIKTVRQKSYRSGSIFPPTLL